MRTRKLINSKQILNNQAKPLGKSFAVLFPEKKEIQISSHGLLGEISLMGQCLYYIDKKICNKGYHDVNFNFHTSHKDFWDSKAEFLEDLFFRLTKFPLFIKPVYEKHIHKTDSDLKHRFSRILLFSGGVDSTSALILQKRKGKKNLLCHSATSLNPLAHIKRALGAIYDKNKHPSLLRVKSMYKGVSHDFIPQTRALLFILNAVLLAENHSSIILAENGPLALNPTISEMAEPTIGTRPDIISDLATFLSSINGQKFFLKTPFFDYTKSELIQAILPHKNVLLTTSSCFSYSRKTEARMCGKCLSCIIRFLSFSALGIKENLTSYARPREFPLIASTRSNKSTLLLLADAIERWGKWGSQKEISDLSICSVILQAKGSGRIDDPESVLVRHGEDMILGLRNFYKERKHSTILGRVFERVLKENPLDNSDFEEIIERINQKAKGINKLHL